MKKRKLHKGTNTAVWGGALEDRYYYTVKNIDKVGKFIVPFSNFPEYGMYQIMAVQGGSWSLIETEKPLPLHPSVGKLLKKHKDVEKIREKLRKSHDRIDREGNEVEGTPIDEKEVFI